MLRVERCIIQRLYFIMKNDVRGTNITVDNFTQAYSVLAVIVRWTLDVSFRLPPLAGKRDSRDRPIHEVEFPTRRQ